jgi:hypothetical protein
MKNFNQDSQCHGQGLNQAPPEHISEATRAKLLGKILLLFCAFKCPKLEYKHIKN